MRAFAHADCCNLHCGALKGTPWGWLGPPALSTGILQLRRDIMTAGRRAIRVRRKEAKFGSTPGPASIRKRVSLAMCLRRRNCRVGLLPVHQPVPERSLLRPRPGACNGQVQAVDDNQSKAALYGPAGVLRELSFTGDRL